MKKNTNIKRNQIEVDYMNKKIFVSKAFYTAACKFGTPENELLQNAVQKNPTFTIEFKSSEKKTYNGLTIQKMAAYIETLENSDQMLAKFEAVKKVAEARKALYPLTKQWFLKTFENITMKEIEEAIKVKDQMDLDAEVAAELDGFLPEMTEQDLEEEEPELAVVA